MKAHTYSCNDFAEALTRGPFAWPGGYPLFFWGEGLALCFSCACEKKRRVRAAIRRTIAAQRKATRPVIVDQDWLVCGQEINWESTDLTCDNCYEEIECAYPESESAE